MVITIYKFHNVFPILLILEKDRTTVEWTWCDVIETHTIKDCPPQTFLANSVPGRRCRSRQFFGLQRIFCLTFPEKLLCDKLSLYKFSLAVGTFHFHLPCYHRNKNRKLGTWNLVLNNQPDKSMLGPARTLPELRNHLAQYSKHHHLPHSSEVWRSVRILAVAAGKKRDT